MLNSGPCDPLHIPWIENGLLHYYVTPWPSIVHFLNIACKENAASKKYFPLEKSFMNGNKKSSPRCWKSHEICVECLFSCKFVGR